MTFDRIGSSTPRIVEMALDGLSMRHQAISSNIANVNTIGYRPITVSFESQLSGIYNQDTSIDSSETQFQLNPFITYGKKQSVGSSNSSLDASTVMLNQNVIQYQALIKGMQHYIVKLHRILTHLA